MPKFKVVLLDVDGVLLLVPKFFSHVYAEERGFDIKPFDDFFTKYAEDAARGTTNYKTLIEQHNDVWRWDKSPEELLDKWFRYENFPNNELIEFTKQLRKNGALVYLASDQDTYRAKYLKDNMFKGLLDGAFISSEIGHVKKEPEFFANAVKTLLDEGKITKPSGVIYFDDLQHNINSAAQAGISAYLYESLDQVKELMKPDER